MSYKERINELLKARNMSGLILAQRMGITSAAFYKTLNNPTLQSILRTADALGVPAHELLREDGPGGGPRVVCPHCGREIVVTVTK